jgi:penicillin-binding protein 1A
MVGGRDFAKAPFNLATQGQRQPGSAFKPFVLAAALRKGISPTSTWTSRKKVFIVPHSGGKEKFVVNNYEGAYSGVSTLARATTFSDNSVYAEVGFKVGFNRIARMAKAMGIRSPVSTNPAISLGGLKHGVSALDMAHAYETLAHNGQRVEGSLASDRAPAGIRAVEAPKGSHGFKTIAENKPHLSRVFSPRLAEVEKGILASVVAVGTGTRARLSGATFVAGKTGTTENYGDAWFVGFTDRMTVAVWVGYPDGVRPMKTEFGGQPVAGGTFPTLIWHDFMSQALGIQAARDAARRAKKGLPPESTSTLPAPAAPVTPAPAAPTGGGKTKPAPQAAPKTPARKPTPAPAPAPQPAEPPPGDGTGGTGGTGGAGTP